MFPDNIPTVRSVFVYNVAYDPAAFGPTAGEGLEARNWKWNQGDYWLSSARDRDGRLAGLHFANHGDALGLELTDIHNPVGWHDFRVSFWSSD